MTGATYVEVERLARVLGVDAERLGGLVSEVAPQDLREFRAAVVEDLLQRNSGAFQNAVALAERVPGRVGAQLAQRVLGPALAGRMATFLQPRTANDLARRVSPGFLADIAQHVDATRIGGLVEQLETRTLVGAAMELREREDWVALAGFAEHVSAESLPELIAALDEIAHMETLAMVDDIHIDRLVAAAADDRLLGLADSATSDYHVEILVVIGGRLGSEQQRFAELVIARTG